jgi:hypothetical protein
LDLLFFRPASSDKIKVEGEEGSQPSWRTMEQLAAAARVFFFLRRRLNKPGVQTT